MRGLDFRDQILFWTASVRFYFFRRPPDQFLFRDAPNNFFFNSDQMITGRPIIVPNRYAGLFLIVKAPLPKDLYMGKTLNALTVKRLRFHFKKKSN